MKASGESADGQAAPSLPLPIEEEKKRQILRELDNILESRFFRSAERSKQFLKYVVQYKLNGHLEQLKERTIGVEVFERPHDYATGDDPVVRVQAGEVRRRLDQYYQAAHAGSLIHIELPVGSYSPLFREASTAALSHAAPAQPISPESEGHHKKNHRWRWAIAAICSVLVIGAGIALPTLHRTASRKSAMDQFWNPALASPQPVLICLGAPVVYRPTNELYARYSRAHPGTFQNEVDKTNNVLPLDPKERILWGDLWAYTDYGVARGDAYTAVTLSSLFGKLGKPSQLRIGMNCSFEDLRNSPAVVVGAFNNRWTMQITSSLHFVFVDQNGHFTIREQANGGRVWEKHWGKNGQVIDDSAIVGRLLDSKTGQFTITLAGIGTTGTQSAGEFVSNPEFLEQGLRSAPSGWQTKNLEFVIETTATDSVPGPPRVVAAYSW